MEDRGRKPDRVEHGAAADGKRERLPVDVTRREVLEHVLDTVVVVLDLLAARHHHDLALDRHGVLVSGGMARDPRHQRRRDKRHTLVDEHRDAVALRGLEPGERPREAGIGRIEQVAGEVDRVVVTNRERLQVRFDGRGVVFFGVEHPPCFPDRRA